MFEVTPLEIAPGQSVSLRWSVTGVDAVTIEPLPGNLPPSGNLADTPSLTTAYVLRASNADGAVSLVREIVVLTAPVDSGASATPTASPTPGQITPSPTATSLASGPTIAGLTPAQAIAGASGLTLTVSGGNFVSGSTVYWNGFPRPTAFASAARLTASISASDLATAGTVLVTVVNPGGLTSGASNFTVNNPVPIIGGLAPNSAIAGDAAFTLEINGSGFNSQTIARWNGSPRAVISVGPTQLKVSIPASDLTSAGSVTVSLINPAPGGGSDATIFTVVAPTGTATPTPTATADVFVAVLQQATTATPLRELKVGQHISADGSFTESEVEASGPMACLIRRNTCAYNQLAAITAPAILLGNGEAPPYNSEDRLVHPAIIGPITRLARLTEAEWGGAKQVMITEADDSQLVHDQAQTNPALKYSLHYDGRAVDLSLWPPDLDNLGRLCALAHAAGFDWAHNEGDHCHASVRAESLCVCGTP